MSSAGVPLGALQGLAFIASMACLNLVAMQKYGAVL